VSEFPNLSEEEQVARLGRLAEGALAAWGLEDAAVTPIKYRENAVFRVEAPDGELRVLRVHRADYRSDAAIRSEAAWMQALSRDGGVPTPAMLPTRDGDVLTSATADGVPGARQCDLLAWVEGSPLGTLEHGVDLADSALRETYGVVGEIAGRIHAHAESWTPPPEFQRPSWDAASLVGDDPAFGRFWELSGLEDAELDLLMRARTRVRRRLAELSPAGLLIHGDLIPDNLLASSRGVRVIDFDDCGWSWASFELVTSLFPLLISGGFDMGSRAYLEGYRSVRPFPEAELEWVPSLVMARALSYLGWPQGRPEITTQQSLIPFLIKAVCERAELYLTNEG
jgi:Ser/Thr protein kinase RdoA (MazF antagonist)